MIRDRSPPGMLKGIKIGARGRGKGKGKGAGVRVKVKVQRSKNKITVTVQGRKDMLISSAGRVNFASTV